MLVLVATDRDQGAHEGDYCWTVNDELVMLPILECDDPDRCGCGRGFAGMTSHKATTTALIVERPDLDRDGLAKLIGDSWLDQNYFRTGDWDEAMGQEVDLIELITQRFGEGTVVGRQGTLIIPRARIGANR